MAIHNAGMLVVISIKNGQKITECRQLETRKDSTSQATATQSLRFSPFGFAFLRCGSFCRHIRQQLNRSLLGSLVNVGVVLQNDCAVVGR